MKQSVIIVNTGCANIASVKYAFERLGCPVQVSDNAEVIQGADKVILPGVGSAPAAMRSITDKGLAPVLTTLTQPVLGVCLGMQLMVETSAETAGEPIACLGLMPGQVTRLQAQGQRLPHMGWNAVTPLEHDSLFKGITAGTYFYFVHSFGLPAYAHTLASCDYGSTFSAAIKHNNFYGVQFHPERSGDAGAQLLTNFVNLSS